MHISRILGHLHRRDPHVTHTDPHRRSWGHRHVDRWDRVHFERVILELGVDPRQYQARQLVREGVEGIAVQEGSPVEVAPCEVDVGLVERVVDDFDDVGGGDAGGGFDADRHFGGGGPGAFGEFEGAVECDIRVDVASYDGVL